MSVESRSGHWVAAESPPPLCMAVLSTWCWVLLGSAGFCRVLPGSAGFSGARRDPRLFDRGGSVVTDNLSSLLSVNRSRPPEPKVKPKDATGSQQEERRSDWAAAQESHF